MQLSLTVLVNGLRFMTLGGSSLVTQPGHPELDSPSLTHSLGEWGLWCQTLAQQLHLVSSPWALMVSLGELGMWNLKTTTKKTLNVTQSPILVSQLLLLAGMVYHCTVYHWRELQQISFLSRQTHVYHDKTCLLSWQKYACHDKTFVITKLFCCCNKHNFVATIFCCCDKHTFFTTNMCRDKSMLLMTKPLSRHLWQKFCRDKHTFVMTKDSFHDDLMMAFI